MMLMKHLTSKIYLLWPIQHAAIGIAAEAGSLQAPHQIANAKWASDSKSSCAQLNHTPLHVCLGNVPEVLDGVEIWRMRRVPDEECAASLNCDQNALLLKVGEGAVTWGVVQNNDTAWPRVGIQVWRQNALEKVDNVGRRQRLCTLQSVAIKAEITRPLWIEHRLWCDDAECTDDA